MKLLRISPIVLKRHREPFDHPDWLFEIKMDGFRGVAYISDARCKILSRNGNVFHLFDLLADAIRKLKVKDAILDGEVVCLDERGQSQFNQLFLRRGIHYFYAFDLIWLNGRDLRNQPLAERKHRLRDLVLSAEMPVLLFSDHVEECGKDFYRIACEKNLEGIVAKQKQSRYNRQAAWLKFKNPEYTERIGRDEIFKSKSTPVR